MERLWTPWRNEYVVSDKTQGCFLCEKPREDADEENFILHRAELGYILLNAFPYNTGHVMIAPYAHTADFPALGADVGAALWSLTQDVVRALEEEYRPDGFNVGLNLGQAGGAGVVDHLHIHAVPRWSGDTNFMPVVGQTKVLPETLDQTHKRLSRYFKG